MISKPSADDPPLRIAHLADTHIGMETTAASILRQASQPRCTTFSVL